jgi:hypothetical protein
MSSEFPQKMIVCTVTGEISPLGHLFKILANHADKENLAPAGDRICAGMQIVLKYCTNKLTSSQITSPNAKNNVFLQCVSHISLKFNFFQNILAKKV